jgi:hypothetical protein
LRLHEALKTVLTVVLAAFLFAGWVGIAPLFAAESDASAGVKGAPRIQVDRDYVDYGTIPLEQRIEHRTVIRNVGDAPLVLKNICPEHEGMIHSKVLEGC